MINHRSSWMLAEAYSSSAIRRSPRKWIRPGSAMATIRPPSDWNGRLLRIQVRIEEHSFFGMFKRITEHIEIFETEHIPTHEIALRELVSRFIHPGPAAQPDGTVEPLAGLIRIKAIAGTR